MEELVKGDIVVTPFPFSDLKSSTRRPALIVATLKGNDLILCQITSRNHPDPYQVGLNKEELSQGKLSANSFIKPSILFTLRDSIILYKIGRINEIKIKEVENQICEIIRK
ncbi:MAG: type II toxin-antitoxin system PemK/MazF family toxin [Nanoarchaeota archaeon]|nr:type II toxin-antitoxin system PemK/MazF family toxin [Nanoarchaeota archaeon]MBU1501455.1 type II toxin-antitoxin system PemK/MazF family toxin [Nanoarchaeota archaeon]MBU2459121.1 type II toxin-antitoxin system PemK/MazF family toxin [Nanoarchaeota archaeon]